MLTAEEKAEIYQELPWVVSGSETQISKPEVIYTNKSPAENKLLK